MQDHELLQHSTNCLSSSELPIARLEESRIRYFLREKLSADFVQKNEAKLLTNLEKDLKICLFDSLTSTNDFLKAETGSEEDLTKITLCCAEQQSQGRGRFGRKWLSPPHSNLYFSIKYQSEVKLSYFSPLSLVAGLALLKTIKEILSTQPLLPAKFKMISQKLKLKWPNDLFFDDKKIAGILIETQKGKNFSQDLIIGIGVNVNICPTILEKNLTQDGKLAKLSSLKAITGIEFDRNELIASLLLNLTSFFQLFLKEGFSAFQFAWQDADYLLNQSIAVQQPNSLLQGYARGVTNAGALLLEDRMAKFHALTIGDTSLYKDL